MHWTRKYQGWDEMKKVNRSVIPDSLRINGGKWTADLLAAVQQTGEFSKVSSSLKSNYNQPDVKAALEKMYSGKCCYCERYLGIDSYEHIEHRKPKGLPQFHHLTYEWNNLHWCCQMCNMAKRNQWDDEYPILDPAVEDPKEHVTFNIITGEIAPIQNQKRGETTIKHADLNRDKLVRARERISQKVIKTIVRAKSTPTPEDEAFYKESLLELTHEEADFSSFMEQIVREYL